MAESPFDWVDKPLPENNAIVVSYEMSQNVQDYLDYIQEVTLRGKRDVGYLMIEQRVDFSDWVSEGFGTCDALIFKSQSKTLHIIDLKYGKGVRVYAKDNTQGILYALGAVSDFGHIYDIQHVVIGIMQPRLDHIDEWELSRDELMRWGETIKQGAEAALADNAPRTPGEKQCQWCRAKATCAALHKLTTDTLLADFDNLDSIANPDTLDDVELHAALAAKKTIVAWLDSVEQLVTARLNDGGEFKGYKLVAGRSNRAWGDENLAATVLIEALGANAYEPAKLLSVAKAEKALGKSKIHMLDAEGLVIKPQGSPTLVEESDPRPSISASGNDFNVVQ